MHGNGQTWNSTHSSSDARAAPPPLASCDHQGLREGVDQAQRGAGRAGPLQVDWIAAGLMEVAMRTTGLADFGSPYFREPLARLCDSLEREARLTSLGRMIASCRRSAWRRSRTTSCR
jgi:hypothetical protein